MTASLVRKELLMAKLKILIVDDSPTMRRILVNTVIKAGFTDVKEAEDGRDGLAKLMAGDFDLLMTDWNMPNMNGLELTQAVRVDDKLKNMPILMVTTRNMKEDIVNAIKAGVNGYIVKPFDAKTLNSKISEIIG
jgi:two-component system, chemotaxis family, chemotaxis protein CheY